MSTIKGWLGRPWAFCQPRNRPNKISTAAVWQWHQIRKIWTSGSVHPSKRKTSSILSYIFILGCYYLLLSVGNSSVQSLHPMREIRHCLIDRRRWTWNTIGNQKIELVSVVQTSHSAVKIKKIQKCFSAHVSRSTSVLLGVRQQTECCEKPHDWILPPFKKERTRSCVVPVTSFPPRRPKGGYISFFTINSKLVERSQPPLHNNTSLRHTHTHWPQKNTRTLACTYVYICTYLDTSASIITLWYLVKTVKLILDIRGVSLKRGPANYDCVLVHPPMSFFLCAQSKLELLSRWRKKRSFGWDWIGKDCLPRKTRGT